MMKKLIFVCVFSLGFGMSAMSCSGGTEKKADTTATEKQETVANADGVTGATPYAGKVHALTLDTYSKYVMDTSGETPKYIGKRPAVIDFYATWCGPCKRMAPIVEELAKEFAGKVDFYQVDVDKESELARMFGIEAMPTFAFISADGKLSSSVGMQSKEDFRKSIEDYCLSK